MKKPAATNSLVLLIDDDYDALSILGELLENAGYRFHSASDGRQAMKFLQTTPVLPALILLDLMMPEMTGQEFRVLQQRSPALAQIPVVVMSADAHIQKKTLGLNVQGVLEKPFSLTHLIEVVTRFCGPPPPKAD